MLPKIETCLHEVGMVDWLLMVVLALAVIEVLVNTIIVRYHDNWSFSWLLPCLGTHMDRLMHL